MPPSAPVQAMIAFNYYAAERVHPCSVLGMLYMLEVVSSVYGGRVSDSIARALGRDVDGGRVQVPVLARDDGRRPHGELNRAAEDDRRSRGAGARSSARRSVNFHQFGQMFWPRRLRLAPSQR